MAKDRDDTQSTGPSTKPALQVLTVTRAMLRASDVFTVAAARHSYAGIGGDYKELLTTSAVGASADEQPALLLVAAGDTPIGRISLLEGLVHADGRPIPMLWCSGLDVQDQHRQTGAGLMLMLKLRSLPLPVGVVGVSRRALDVYIKLGWRDMAATRYVFVLRSRPIVEARLGTGLMARLLRTGTDTVLRLHRAAFLSACAWRARGLSVECCEALPAELDRLMQTMSNTGLRCHRSTRWVNWCMKTGPKQNQRSLHLIRGSRGEPLGYFMHSVLTHQEAGAQPFSGLRLASLRDWLSFDQDRLPDSLLILVAVRSMMQRDADAIEVCVPEDAVGAKLSWFGMLQRGKLHFLLRAPSDSVLNLTPAETRRDWWWRPADGDGFVN